MEYGANDRGGSTGVESTLKFSIEISLILHGVLHKVTFTRVTRTI